MIDDEKNHLENITAKIKEAVGSSPFLDYEELCEDEITLRPQTLREFLLDTHLSSAVDKILDTASLVAAEVVLSLETEDKFSITLPHNCGVATVRQTEDGKFYIWVINDKFSDNGYQYLGFRDSFIETVLLIINGLIPELEKYHNTNPYEGMTTEQIVELQKKRNAKIFRNAIVGNLRIMRKWTDSL